ncbi:uncharacterized protein LOC6648943 isoform X2 [Drosophila willistoni]|nr:uncharacterized protein LOC6648943 isoform X2 [Drosophila willistoni]
MVPVLKFMTIHTDRVIIKEGDTPITVYFIITGEVEMKKRIYNKKTKEVTWISEAIFGPGDCIGDVEKVEDCARMYTYVAVSNCELLAIFEADYNRILGPFMTKQWNEKKKALRSLDYFEFFNESQRIHACKFGSLVQYEPLETIYYEDKGSVSYVHFILSGECVILQCLNMLANIKNGRIGYELTDLNRGESVMFPESEKSSRASKLPSILSRYRPGVDDQQFDVQDILATSSEDNETKQKNKALRKMTLNEIEAYCGIGKTLEAIKQRRKHKTFKVLKHYRPKHPKHTKHRRFYSEDVEEEYDDEFDMLNDEEEEGGGGSMYDDYYYEYIEEEYSDDDIDEDVKEESRHKMNVHSTFSMAKSRSALLNRKLSLTEVDGENSESGSEIFTVSNSESSEGSSSLQIIQECSYKRPSHLTETHFIDVGSLTYGGIFGLGEKMEHRVIMSRTVVQCLLLPRFWLMEQQQNPGHIWPLRRFYFECNVPTRGELFANYLKTRRWNDFRHKYVQSCLSPSQAMGNTKEEDIPIISRIVETSDD